MGVKTLPERDASEETYYVTTASAVATGTSVGTVTSVCTLWHAASSQRTVHVHHLELHGSAGASGVYDIRIHRISADGTGGTLRTPAPLNTSNRAAEVSLRAAPTGAPTRGAQFYCDPMSGAEEIDVHIESHDGAQPITLRAGVAEGIEISTAVMKNMSSAAEICVNILFTEH